MSRIIKRPIISEKTTLLNERDQRYVFEVDINASKPEIKVALKELYPDVEIASVNTMIMPSKPKGRFTRGGYQAGRTAKRKKAIVTLKSGEIDLYEEI
jgi:large subunit ribosomal protein L23